MFILLLLVVLLCPSASAVSRHDAFIGYQERTDTQERVVLQTKFGEISIRLLTDIAPQTAKLVTELAQGGKCEHCRFYRCDPPPTSANLGDDQQSAFT